MKPSRRRFAYCVRVMMRSPTRMTIASRSCGGGEGGRGGGECEGENAFSSCLFVFDVDVDAAVAVRRTTTVRERFIRSRTSGSVPVYLKGRRLVRTAICISVARACDELSHALADGVLVQPLADDGRGRLRGRSTPGGRRSSTLKMWKLASVRMTPLTLPGFRAKISSSNIFGSSPRLT